MACLTTKGTTGNTSFMDTQQYLLAFVEHCGKLENYYKKRDVMIFELFELGVRQKVLSSVCGLSTSRIKAIVMEQRKLGGKP